MKIVEVVMNGEEEKIKRALISLGYVADVDYVLEKAGVDTRIKKFAPPEWHDELGCIPDENIPEEIDKVFDAVSKELAEKGITAVRVKEIYYEAFIKNMEWK